VSFQILDIVVYGPTDEPRVVSLRPGQMNIITGSSKSGKSALVPIVDYCLGASECAVAHGPIRNTVEWYAVRLAVGDQQVFVARQAPPRGGESNSAVYYEVGATVQIPPKSGLAANTSVDAAVELLSRDAGIVDNRHTPPPGQTRAPLAATIKHAVHFCFQPQDEIISRKKLFYQQSDHWIEQSIQDSLPYFVGAIGDDHIIKVGRLRQLRHEHRKLMQRLAEAEAIRGEGSGRAAGLLREASDLGTVDLPIAGITFDESVALLRQVLDRQIATASEQGVDGADEYAQLIETRDRLAQQLRRADEDYQAARKLIRERTGYSKETTEKAGRLRSIGLFEATTTGQTHSCPLCMSELADLPNDVELKQALTLLEQQLGDVAQGNPHLERLTARLEEQVNGIRTQLSGTQQALYDLQRQRREVAEYRDYVARLAHVRGRISIYLESVPSEAVEVSDIAVKADALSAQIAALEEELSQSAVEERLESIVSVISRYVTEYGRRLALEHSENPLRFHPKKLTVIADTPTGPIPMEKMGSGENWVGYHLAAHLAVHRLFVGSARPVPRFLFLDQPSQVYFPADRDTTGRLEVGREGAPLDEDRAAVLRMFELLHDHVADLDGEFQIVLTEHADPMAEWYQAAVVERWRDGVKLIPQEWIDTLAQPSGPEGAQEPDEGSTS
jgi:hypothetical protein